MAPCDKCWMWTETRVRYYWYTDIHKNNRYCCTNIKAFRSVYCINMSAITKQITGTTGDGRRRANETRSMRYIGKIDISTYRTFRYNIQHDYIYMGARNKRTDACKLHPHFFFFPILEQIVCRSSINIYFREDR